MILLDTSVLSYAAGVEHELRRPCRRVLEAHASRTIEATTTVEVLQEFLHVRARRHGRPDATTLTRDYATAFDLIATQPSDLERALDLFARHPELGSFDAVLAAVALERRADALISADRGFASVPGLRWIDPASRELEALLDA